MNSLENPPRISPFLWFDSNAEEAVEFYLSVFKNSRRIGELRNPGEAPGSKGSVLTSPLNWKACDLPRSTAARPTPLLRLSPLSSAATRSRRWTTIGQRLTSGGAEVACGWLRDKFGLAWQVVPARLPELVSNPKAMRAMMGMKKLDIAELERAAQS